MSRIVRPAAAMGRGSGRQKPLAQRCGPPWALVLVLAVLAAVFGPWAGGDASAVVRVRVAVEGLDGAPLDNVRSLLSIRELEGKDGVDEAAVRRRHARAEHEIAVALQPFGYYQPRVVATLERSGDRWVARYRIARGPLTRIASLELRLAGAGADDPALEQRVASFALARGDVLNHAAYESAKQSLSGAALARGYLNARFTTHEVLVHPDSAHADVHLVLDTGPRFRYGPVQFQQDVLDSSLLRGYVTFEAGEPVDFDQLMGLQNALSRSPYFRSVEVRPDADDAMGDRVPIVVGLEPLPAVRFEAGAGYGTDTGPRGRGAVQFRRLNRSGHRAETEFRVSTIEKSATTQYVIPWPYPRTDRLALSAGYADLETETSDSRTWRAGIKYTRARGHWQEMLSLLYQRETFVVGEDRGTKVLFQPEASWSRVRADDRLDPANGYRVRLTARGAHKDVLSDVTFLTFETRVKGIVALAPRTRLVARFDVGTTASGRFRDLPPSVRFFAGGAQSVRGYRYQSLGPRGEDGRVVGGQSLLVGSLELEQRVFKRWGLAVFYDAGNAFRSFSDPVANGAGLGLRWISPVGPIRADGAFGLNDPGRPLRFHLTIGPAL